LEAQDDVAFGDARLFQTFGDSQVGVVSLKLGFPIDDLRTDYRGRECAAALPNLCSAIAVGLT
jgi:hypothetical protein